MSFQAVADSARAPAEVCRRARNGPTEDSSDAPLGPRVHQAEELLRAVVAELDPARLTGADAARLYGLLASIERLVMAGKTLLAPRIDESGIWRDSGHRNTAVMLAELEGVPTGQARNTLEVGQRLQQLPGTEQALRNGVLSGPKVSELSGAAVLDPGGEAELLHGAAEEGLQRLKERCQRSRPPPCETIRSRQFDVSTQHGSSPRGPTPKVRSASRVGTPPTAVHGSCSRWNSPSPASDGPRTGVSTATVPDPRGTRKPTVAPMPSSSS